MTVGRKPLPDEMHKLHGNPGKRKRTKTTTLSTGVLFDPPSWFNAEQRDEWQYILDNVMPGLLTTVDRANLTAYCVAAALHKRATRELNKAKSLFVKVGENGALAQHPALAVINKQAQIMVRCAAEMGFTPSSRSRVAKGGELPEPNAKPATSPTGGAAKTGGLEGFIANNPDRPN